MNVHGMVGRPIIWGSALFVSSNHTVGKATEYLIGDEGVEMLQLARREKIVDDVDVGALVDSRQRPALEPLRV